jgi:hypothetical protein
VVRNAKPNVLIGVSGQPGAFSEPVVRAMAEHNKRPVIFPLSNPTSRAEATPEDLEVWTEGRAVIGTGSPFPPLTRGGIKFKVEQFLHLSRGRPGRNCGQSAAHHGFDVHGSSQGARQLVSGPSQSQRQLAAAGDLAPGWHHATYLIDASIIRKHCRSLRRFRSDVAFVGRATAANIPLLARSTPLDGID